ncbi:MAG: TIGR03943 family protein [Mycolicibacterium insubricum]
MKRETENIVLLLVGISVALIVVGGEYTRYVKPGLLVWLAASAVVLIGLAVLAMAGDIRRGRPEPEPGHGGHDHDGHRHRGGIAWLLLVPVIVLIFVKPPPIGAGARTPSISTAASASATDFPPLPPGPAPEVSLPDVVMRAANDKAHSLDGRTITVTAFVLHEPAGPDLGRVVIICCAADAQLARIHLRGPGAIEVGGWPDNTWVRAVGVVTPASPDPTKVLVPTLTATTVTRVDAPANPYAYPG